MFVNMCKMLMYQIIVVLLVGNSFIECIEKGFSMGCYQSITGAQTNQVDSTRNYHECIDLCNNKYYRYSFVRLQDEKCICGNYLGDQKDPRTCSEFCNGCDIKNEISDVYYTGVSENGPPRNLRVENISDTEAHIAWNEPESFVDIEYYKVVAQVIFTYSTTKLNNLSWKHSNNTFRVELILLHPGTRYNITVQAVSKDAEGAAIFKDFETLIGVPDYAPKQPEIIEVKNQMMKIKIDPVRTNNNGPITSYIIVVIKDDSVQTVQIENLKPFRQANNEGYTYYITGEIQSDRVGDVFTIGDGKSYGKYYNGPLEKGKTYHVMIGVVSRTHTAERVVYSRSYSERHENDVMVIDMSKDDANGDTPVLIIGLSVAIGLMSCLLIVGIIGFYVLRNHVHLRHRQRLNDNQELTMQGPMIDIENYGYVHEEQNAAGDNHYENLNEQVWIIPRNLLNIEHTILLGIGKFGRVHSGTVLKDDNLLPTGVYSIADRKLNPEDKRSMLKDLDILIKSKKHANVIDLIGTCESMDTICVVLELSTINLKDFLIASRSFNKTKFAKLSEAQAMEFAIDIAKGMDFLHTKKILHKQLCSLHVAVIDGCIAKISGFGLARYYKNDISPDFVRFNALEVLKKQQNVTKSDVWSFACVIWEIATLGGTPYAQIATHEVAEKVIKGLRLTQLPYINDSLYQIMLNCWQFDWDERPTFNELIECLEQIKYDQYVSCINFTLYPDFQYEIFNAELETVRNLI